MSSRKGLKPMLKKSQRYTAHLHICVTPKMQKELEEIAEMNGIRVSEAIRQLLAYSISACK